MEETVHISAFGSWAKYWLPSPEGTGEMNLIWLRDMSTAYLTLPNNAFDALNKIYFLVDNGKDVFTTEIIKSDVHNGVYGFLDDDKEEDKVFQKESGTLCNVKLSTKPFS